MKIPKISVPVISLILIVKSEASEWIRKGEVRTIFLRFNLHLERLESKLNLVVNLLTSIISISMCRIRVSCKPCYLIALEASLLWIYFFTNIFALPKFEMLMQIQDVQLQIGRFFLEFRPFYNNDIYKASQVSYLENLGIHFILVHTHIFHPSRSFTMRLASLSKQKSVICALFIFHSSRFVFHSKFAATWSDIFILHGPSTSFSMNDFETASY